MGQELGLKLPCVSLPGIYISSVLSSFFGATASVPGQSPSFLCVIQCQRTENDALLLF